MTPRRLAVLVLPLGIFGGCTCKRHAPITQDEAAVAAERGGSIRLVEVVPETSAVEVERVRAVPLERALTSIAGVAHVTSRSTDGRLFVFVDVASNAVTSDVRAAIEARMDPKASDEARVEIVYPHDRLGRFVLSSTTVPIVQLGAFAEGERAVIASMPGVLGADVCNPYPRRLGVEFDSTALARSNVSLAHALDVLRAVTSDDPVAIGETTLGAVGGAPIRVRDVAAIGEWPDGASRELAPSTACVSWSGAAAADVITVAMRTPSVGAEVAARLQKDAPEGVSVRAIDPTTTLRLDIDAPATASFTLLTFRQEIQEAIAPSPMVRSVVSFLNDGAGDEMSLDDAFEIFVTLDPGASFSDAARDLDARLARLSPDLPSLSGRFKKLDGSPAVPGALVASLRVLGDELADVSVAATKIEAALSKVDGFAGTTRLGDVEAPTILVSIDAAKCAALGVSPSDAKLATDLAFHDVRAGRLLVGWREVSSSDPMTIRSVLIAGSSATPVTSVAAFREVPQPWSILRRDGKREVVVHVSISGRDLAGFERDAERAIAAAEIPPGCEAHWSD